MARPPQIKQHLYDLRNEFIWFLDSQGYDGVDIALVLSKDRSAITRALKKKPDGWRPRWKRSSY